MILSLNTSKYIVLSLSFFIISACSQNVDKQLNESRNAIKDLAGQLQHTLKTSMQNNGPIKALNVCNVEAEKIAADISKANAVEVGRTSLKIRSPNNLSDTWETEVLRYFEQQRQNGTELENLEIYEITKNETGKWFRYMKAIPTSEVCLICHGENIAPDIHKQLQSLYPNDQATGYKVGDIRGAFSVKIKL